MATGRPRWYTGGMPRRERDPRTPHQIRPVLVMWQDPTVGGSVQAPLTYADRTGQAQLAYGTVDVALIGRRRDGTTGPVRVHERHDGAIAPGTPDTRQVAGYGASTVATSTRPVALRTRSRLRRR